MYIESTHKFDITVCVTYDVSNVEVGAFSVKSDCCTTKTRMTIYRGLSIQQNVSYFLTHYFLIDPLQYKLYTPLSRCDGLSN